MTTLRRWLQTGNWLVIVAFIALSTVMMTFRSLKGVVVTGLRVLLVEDDALNQELVRVILGRSADPVLAGAGLVVAGSLAQARAILAADVIDVVLLDLHLPDGSGLDLAAEISCDGNRASPVVIALSGAKERYEAAMAVGCTAMLGKPYGADELCRQIIAHLPRIDT